jgi:hypothetical protein
MEPVLNSQILIVNPNNLQWSSLLIEVLTLHFQIRLTTIK